MIGLCCVSPQSNCIYSRELRDSEEFLPKLYLVGTYGQTITKDHFCRQPRFVSSKNVAVRGSGDLDTNHDCRNIRLDNNNNDSKDDNSYDDSNNSDEETPEEGLLRNATIAKAFQILMEARPTQIT